MSKQLTDAKREAIKRYDAANTRQYHLKLNKKTDADIIELFDQQDSVQGYIKELVRADIEKSKVRTEIIQRMLLGG